MISGPIADWLADLTGLQILLWILAVAAVLGFVWKAWPIIRRAVKLIDALGELPEYMERIRHQVENDHDTNLRDEVTQLLELVTDIARKVAQVFDWQKKHERRSDALVARIVALEKKEKADG
ncbi:hypothetical protein [Microbacterium sp. MMO-10]|uniref:hypothetical protein n=1 Tax=Microbacterium sp. MMO-10 TaxID=3081272 RepID=UPI00301645CB